MSLNTTPVDVAESDCAAIWELEEGAVACGSQKSRRGWCSRTVRPSITRSISCKCTALHRARQFLNILISLSSKSFSLRHCLAWKHRSLRNFQVHHINAAQQVLRTAFFLLLIHHLAADSKLAPKFVLKISDRWHQIDEGTQQPKKRWCTVSFSSQKRQLRLSKCCLFERFILVKVLSLAKSHKKVWILGGTLSCHTTGVYTGWTPLKLNGTLQVSWSTYICFLKH